MTFELRILALSVVLGLVQIVLASHAASLQRGYLWTAGSRDEAVPPLTGIAGRLERALRNFVETFPLFAAAVLIAHVTNTHSWMTEWGVQLYFGARVAYLAVYAAGVFLLRSLVWNVATLGIAMVLLSLVLNDASAVEHAARSGLYCRLLLKPSATANCRARRRSTRIPCLSGGAVDSPRKTARYRGISQISLCLHVRNLSVESAIPASCLRGPFLVSRF